MRDFHKLINSKYCQFKGHENNQRILICVHKDCNQNNKWVCSVCASECHQHDQANKNHFLDKLQFQEFIKRQQQKYDDSYKNETQHIQYFIKELQQLIKYQQEFLNKLIDDLVNLQKNYTKEAIQMIIEITNSDFLSLENHQINQIIKLEYQNFQNELQLSKDLFKQLIKHYQDLQEILQVCNNQFINDKIRQLDSHYELTTDKWIYTSQISKNEQYLATGYGQKVDIVNPQSKQIVKCIEIENSATICRFTDDSRYLISGDHLGQVYCYDINNNFKEIFKKKLHSSRIQDLILFDNDRIITCSQDKSIIQYNFKRNKQQLLIQNAHNDYVNSIQYDSQKQVIISCSRDEFIRFFNSDGKILLEKQNAHVNTFGIEQLQLIKNNKLLSSSAFELILWDIDYDQQTLIQSKLLKRLNYNFSLIQSQKSVVLISDKFIEVLDNSLNEKQKIKHNISKLEQYIRTGQLNSLNYIIVPGKYNLEVLKAI